MLAAKKDNLFSIEDQRRKQKRPHKRSLLGNCTYPTVS
jgi:hypothetical protein